MIERLEATTEEVPVGLADELARLHACRSDPGGDMPSRDDKSRACEAHPRHRRLARGKHDYAATGKVLRTTSSGSLRGPKEAPAKHRRSAARRRFGLLLSLLATLLLFAGVVCATDFADQTISTDRPGIPYGTSIVPTGHLQLETGLPTFENDPLPGGHSLLLSAPTYLRYGVSDDFEVQLAASPWNQLTTTQDGHRHSVSGAGDLQLGGKFALSSGGGAMPAVTLIGYVTAPSGNSKFSDGRAAYNLNMVASWSLTGSTGFTTMASFARAPADGDRHANSGTLAASLSHNFTPRLAAYAETGWFPGYTNTSSTALAGGGVTYLLAPHVQVDGFFDVGLNHDSPTSVFGTGVSILF